MGNEILLVFVIYCTFAYLIAQYLGRNRQIGFGWALFFSFFLSPIGGLIITILSPKDFENNQEPSSTKNIIGWILIVFFSFSVLMKLFTLENVPTEHLSMQINSISIGFGFIGLGYYLILLSKGNILEPIIIEPMDDKDPLETLKSLFDSGVLSETEYIEKLNNYNERFKIEEKQIEDKKQQQQFQKLFDERTIPLIKLIDDAKMQGVITQIEFEKKKEEIISKNSEEIKYILSQKPRFSDISDNIELVNKYEGRVKIFLDRLQPEQLLIYAYGDFQNITREKWEKMLKSEDAKNYKLIIEYKIPKENNP